MNTIEAGRELDVLIAKKVMGWERVERNLGWSTDPQIHFRRLTGKNSVHPSPAPHFSTDIAAAWLIVEHMREQGWLYGIGDIASDTHETIFYLDGIGPICGMADTAPLSICKAALATVASYQREGGSNMNATLLKGDQA